MVFLLKILFTAVEFFAMILVCLSLFRIYFRYALHKVLFITIVLSAISVYVRDFLQEPGMAALPVIITELVLITLCFGLPLVFSLLVVVIGSLATTTVEGLVVSIGSYFDIFSQEQMQVSVLMFMCHELVITAILLLIVYILQKYKLGFHTTSNDALKGYNFLLSAMLIVAVVAIQVLVLAFKHGTVHLLIPIVMGVIFLVGIYFAHKHNKQLWTNRRERLSKR